MTMVRSSPALSRDETCRIDMGCHQKDVLSWATTFQPLSDSLLYFLSSFIAGIYVWMILEEVGLAAFWMILSQRIDYS